MYDPEFLPSRYLRRSFLSCGQPWQWASLMFARIQTLARRAIAQPAKSAVATAAIGVIVGAMARTALVRYSEPARASAAQGAIPKSKAPSSRPFNQAGEFKITPSKSSSLRSDEQP